MSFRPNFKKKRHIFFIISIVIISLFVLNTKTNFYPKINPGNILGLTNPILPGKFDNDKILGSIAANAALASPFQSIDANVSITGKVGIGTSDPQYPLDVKGAINASSLYINGAPFTGSSQWTTTGTNIYYSTGRVGVGTNNPGRKLDVNGDAQIGQTYLANSDIYFTNTTHNHTGIGNTSGYAAIENAANFNTLMILGRSGGIGGGRSVSLWDRLDINGTLNVTGNSSVGSNGAGLVYMGNRGYYIGDDLQGSDLQTNAPDIYVYNNNAWRKLCRDNDTNCGNSGSSVWATNGNYIYNTNPGYVGIGTNNPQYLPLQVSVTNGPYNGSAAGVVSANRDAWVYLWTRNGAPNSDLIWRAGTDLVFYTENGIGAGGLVERMRISSNGTLTATAKNFEINHPNKPDYKLIHSSLEGPEVGVFYRGEAQLKNSKTEINLPDYFESLTAKEGRTVLLTAKGSEPFILSASDVKNGKFTVYGTKTDGQFYWEVKAVRKDISPLEVEKPVSKQ